MLRALIVDDEIASVRSLEILLTQFCKQVEVVGIARSVEEALDLTVKQKPNLIFLDIQMPSGTGFDFLEKSICCNFEIVFISAHNNYAVQAFKYSAVDYLLKPIEIDELVKAVEKVTEVLSANLNNRNKYNVLFDNLKDIIPQKLVVVVNGSYEYIDLRDVLYVDLSSSKLNVFLENGTSILIDDSLAAIEDQLYERGFYRIHKDYLLNTQKTKKVLKTNDSLVELSNGIRLPLNPLKRDDLIAKISDLNLKS
ncbi:MAG TPA: hypothetical protein DIW31_04605 [Bacteroidales bacterium]|nr:hypothetical protein [Bacteroidales bacterium]